MLGVKLDLFDEKHRRRMGKAIWLFLPLQALTRLDGTDGHIDFSQAEIINVAREEWGFSERTAYRYFARLVDEGYVTPREDGTWKIARYENIHMFLSRKRGLAKSGRTPVKTDKASAKTGRASVRTGTDLRSESPLGDIEEGEGSPASEGARQRSKESGERRKGDPRLSHPALQTYRSLANLLPERAVWDQIIRCCEEVGEERWRWAIREWIARGYNKRNMTGMMDVARHGFRRDRGSGMSTREHLALIPDLTREDTT